MDLKLNVSTRILSTAVLTTERSSPKECPMNMPQDLSQTRGIVVVDPAKSSGILDVEQTSAGTYSVRLSGDPSKAAANRVVLMPSGNTIGLSVSQVQITTEGNEQAILVVRGSGVAVRKTIGRASSGDSTDGTESEILDVSKVLQPQGAEFQISQPPNVLDSRDEVSISFEPNNESGESVVCSIAVEGCAKVGGWNITILQEWSE